MKKITIKNYKEFSENELKSITLTEDEEDEGMLMLDINGGGMFVEGIPIILVGKYGPSKYTFKLDQKDSRKLKYFKGFVRHFTYVIVKKIVQKSKELYGRALTKKDIKAKLKPVIDEKGGIAIKMRDIHRGKYKEMSTRVVELQDGKEKLIRGMTVRSFIKKYASGTKFTPIYLIDSVLCGRRRIEVVICAYELKVEKTYPKKRKIFTYSDDEEESDQEYAFEEEPPAKPVEKKEKVKEEKKEAAKEEKKGNDIKEEKNVDEESDMEEDVFDGEDFI